MAAFKFKVKTDNAGTSNIVQLILNREVVMAKQNYPVSDVWLHTQDGGAPEYCDIDEITNDPYGNVSQPDNALHQPTDYPNSAYLTWVLANDPTVFTRIDGSAPSRMDHIRAASFTIDGIRVGNIGDINGGNIRGILRNSAIITIGKYDGGVNHDEIYRRIYRVGTEVEKLWFVGY